VLTKPQEKKKNRLGSTAISTLIQEVSRPSTSSVYKGDEPKSAEQEEGEEGAGLLVLANGNVSMKTYNFG